LSRFIRFKPSAAGSHPSGYDLSLFARVEIPGIETRASAPKETPPNAIVFGRSIITPTRFMYSFLSTVIDPAFCHPQSADTKALNSGFSLGRLSEESRGKVPAFSSINIRSELPLAGTVPPRTTTSFLPSIFIILDRHKHPIQTLRFVQSLTSVAILTMDTID
jgi:hypothetical protein